MSDVNVAAVDIGTNSVRLLIADQSGLEVERTMRITRLGQGVDVTGALDPEAIARTTQVLSAYRSRIEHFGVQRVRATATSAARDATNSQHFFDAAERALGVRPELLGGEEEARLSFLGATAELPPRDGPFLVIDVGGGSTELALGTTGPEALVSLQLGCVRMTERHLKTDPPTPQELDACLADIRGQVAKARTTIDPRNARRIVGLAGTVTTLAALELGLSHYDATRTHHSTLTRTQVETWFERLSHMALPERRLILAEPQRAGVILGGAAVLLTLMRELGIAELLVSEHDILDGLVAAFTAAIGVPP
ncbi:MAG TPA: Ppx/GppA phosphatase family protein [Polyangiaceae bacterium]|nr:Ppx/GppA phosphatase family protein [Polyangiaceae bacterium]